MMRLQKPSLRANPSSRSATAIKPARLSNFTVPRAAAAAPAAAEVAPKEDVKPQDKKVDLPDPKVSTKEVASFLKTMVEDTDFVDLHLQVGSFELKVKRSTSAGESAHAHAPPPPAAAPAVAVPPAVFITPPVSPLESIDESMVQVVCSKVGIFRRGRYAGGKRIGKNNVVEEGDQVKKGSPLGYIEQLGTHFPVEAPQAGEVARFKLKDGAPVEYGQLLVEIAPFFGGASLDYLL